MVRAHNWPERWLHSCRKKVPAVEDACCDQRWLCEVVMSSTGLRDHNWHSWDCRSCGDLWKIFWNYKLYKYHIFKTHWKVALWIIIIRATGSNIVLTHHNILILFMLHQIIWGKARESLVYKSCGPKIQKYGELFHRLQWVSNLNWNEWELSWCTVSSSHITYSHELHSCSAYTVAAT